MKIRWRIKIRWADLTADAYRNGYPYCQATGPLRWTYHGIHPRSPRRRHADPAKLVLRSDR